MFPYFELLGRTVGSYALCALVGFIVALCVATKLAKPLKMAFEDVILVFLAIGGGILVGGHLLYAVTHIESIIACAPALFEKIKGGTITAQELIRVVSEWFGGSVFYGGFIGATTALAIYSKCAKSSFPKEFMDIFAVCVPLFHGFGRIGCFLGGCCYGVESPIGFIAHNELLPDMSGVRRFPIALVESGFNLLLFLLLYYFYKTKRSRGRLIYLYLLIYPVGRFVFEFFRGDEIRGVFLKLSTSQWISIGLFLIAVISLARKTGTNRQKIPSTE